MAQTAVTGAAGAYYVAAELSIRDWHAALTLGNAPRTDVIAQRLDTPERVVGVQVKTRLSGDFNIGMKAEEKPSPPGANEWFVLVSLQGAGNRPFFYVVPWNHVAVVVYIGYHAWLRSLGRGGSQRRAHSRRTAAEKEFERYRECWELLDSDADGVPTAMLPDWVWGWYEDVGLPAGHPGLNR